MASFLNFLYFVSGRLLLSCTIVVSLYILGLSHLFCQSFVDWMLGFLFSNPRPRFVQFLDAALVDLSADTFVIVCWSISMKTGLYCYCITWKLRGVVFEGNAFSCRLLFCFWYAVLFASGSLVVTHFSNCVSTRRSSALWLYN